MKNKNNYGGFVVRFAYIQFYFNKCPEVRKMTLELSFSIS